jgi:hypothetical protein
LYSYDVFTIDVNAFNAYMGQKQQSHQHQHRNQGFPHAQPNVATAQPNVTTSAQPDVALSAQYSPQTDSSSQADQDVDMVDGYIRELQKMHESAGKYYS